MATIPRAPLIERRPPPYWVEAPHGEGTSGSPLTLLATYPPIRERNWPTPPPRPVDQSTTLTWTNNNPNLFTNPVPHNQYDWPLPPPARAIDQSTTLTWVHSNINLTNPVPFTQSSWPTPLSRTYLYSTIPHTEGTVGSTAFLPTLPPIRQYDWPAPTERPYGVHLRTWLYNNPNLYTNPTPHNQYDWPLPPAPRTTDTDLRFWKNQNSNIYTPPLPFNQTNWPVPPSTPVDFASTRTWLNENPNIFSNPVPFTQGNWPTPLSRTYLYSVIPHTEGSVGSTAVIPGNPPIRQFNWPKPDERPYGLHLGTWANNNPNLYQNKVPFIQVNWPLPATLTYPNDLRTLLGRATVITPAPPVTPVLRGKYFIGEIQQMGLVTSMNSSTGLLPE